MAGHGGRAKGLAAVNASQPPSLLVRTLRVTIIGVALLLSLIFIVLSVNTRRQVRQNVATTLESTQRMVAELEAQRQRQLQAQAAILVENPTLKAAVETYAIEATANDSVDHQELIETVDNELRALATHVDADVILLVDRQQQTLAAVGPLAKRWPRGERSAFEVHSISTGANDGILHVADSVYRAAWVDLWLQGQPIGRLYVSTLLSDAYASELGQIADAQIAVVNDGRLISGTLTAGAARDFDRTVAATRRHEGTADLNGESFAFRRLVSMGEVSFYALGSIDALSEAGTTAALRTLALVGLGGMLLAFAGSVWLAQSISGPIGQLSKSIERLASTHDVRGQLTPTGTSLELDALAETFNTMMSSLASAERATDAAYTGAIRALAAALDARDPYTAGHSERVSVLSVAIGRTLRLDDAELEILRLGALLHDIGKIGVADAVLRKPGPLTEAELTQIKQHPVLGARILRSVPFLAPHIPIVELHHERPDGQGYPYGLGSDATPLAARIVHVADAYDAMTSARAYRTARSDLTAMAELRRCSGSEFDADIVDALVRSQRDLVQLDALDPPVHEPRVAAVALA